MQVEQLLRACCGIEDDGQSIKLYVVGPAAKRPASSERGVRTDLFHLLGGEEATAVREYLASHPAWQFLQVSPAPPGGVRGQRQARRGRHQK